LHMPSVSSVANDLPSMGRNELLALGGDLFHPSVGLALLLLVQVLNIYKPRGLTRYGWRKEQGRRAAS
ncbi:MAG: DUF2269 domain-containing protein, partial [Actinobacteria bacterium]|nr:DUF2269 domain-containing protein [Actinomycetota bacterium]